MRWMYALLALVLLAVACHGQSTVGGRTSPDGTEEIRCDLPGKLHVKNSVGTDNLGLCVWATLKMMADWQDEPEVATFFDRLKKEPGGGWPKRVDDMMGRHSPKTKYLQSTTGDLSLAQNLVQSGRIVGITYGYSPRYRGSISHMVCLVHCSERWAAILDNNHPGESNYEWMTPAELDKRWKHNRGGWLVALANPPPPPIPVNRAPPQVFGQCFGPLCPAPLEGQYRSVPGGTSRWEQVSPDSEWYDVWEQGIYQGRKRLFYDRSKEEQKTSQAPKPMEKADTRPEPPTGVVPERIEGYGTRWCGRPLSDGSTGNTGEKVPGIPDDKGWKYLSVIAPDSVRRDVLQQLTGADYLRSALDRVKVRAFSPDDALVRQTGLAVGAGTSIVFQAAEQPNGKGEVLHRQGDFKDGPKAFAEAILRADPAYDPAKDPDLRQQQVKPVNPATPDGKPWYMQEWLWTVASLATAYYLGPVASKGLQALRQLLAARAAGGSISDEDRLLLERLKAEQRAKQWPINPPTSP